MAEKLEPGWYWVRWQAGDDWSPARFGRDDGENEPSSIPPALIGPRIEPPADSGEG